LVTLSAYEPVKRFIDLFVGLILFVVLAPVMILSAALVGLTSEGPAIYSQTRAGRNRRLFTIYKLRSMYHDCERLTGPRWSTADDPRITPVGRFLRGTHLDELPQLWNVIKGDMSLIGPRPERPEIIASLEKTVPRYAERMKVRPGLTGLAQIKLPPDADQHSVRRKLVQDLAYVEHIGPWLDLRILVCTGLFLVGVPFSLSAPSLGLGSGRPRRAPAHAPVETTEAMSLATDGGR
jgi:lipopolysaccharide/colanic/teichoic acid biosynthesis glycosyltransferase